jgi:hypothetical protein
MKCLTVIEDENRVNHKNRGIQIKRTKALQCISYERVGFLKFKHFISVLQPLVRGPPSARHKFLQVQKSFIIEVIFMKTFGRR